MGKERGDIETLCKNFKLKITIYLLLTHWYWITPWPILGLVVHICTLWVNLRTPSDGTPDPDGTLKEVVRIKIRHNRNVYLNRPDPIVFIPLAVDTSGLLYDEFIRLLFLWTPTVNHRHETTSMVRGVTWRGKSHRMIHCVTPLCEFIRLLFLWTSTVSHIDIGLHHDPY